MKSLRFLSLLTIMLLIGANVNAMWCFKDGKKPEYFYPGFEPCRNYWDKVVNDDGTPYKGPWAPRTWCERNQIAKPPLNNQLQDHEIVAPIKHGSNQVFLGCEIDQKPIEGSGYLVKYNGECIGFYKNLTEFYKDQASAKKKNSAR